MACPFTDDPTAMVHRPRGCRPATGPAPRPRPRMRRSWGPDRPRRRTRQEDRLAPRRRWRRRRPCFRHNRDRNFRLASWVAEYSPCSCDRAGGERDDQRRWCVVVGATSNNDEDDGHDRIHLCERWDDHEAVRVVGAATVLVANAHVARVGTAAAIV